MSEQAQGELIPVGGGDAIPLIRDHLILGRRETCDICLRFPNVSGQHCELTYQKGYWYIRDLGSTNGIKVNGERVMQKALRPGDEIKIAKRAFIIQYLLQAGRRALEELLEEEEVMGQSLLEKAGLARPEREKRQPRSFEPTEYAFGEDDEEDT
jgi:adenylate cyclase